ncbi:MAG: polysaccharide deacetylase family protein [Bryobacteraceae bacterium]|jgi:peptidoglycan/xylan/chitin deacetylase (PgdA/CDA1 family)
MLHIVMYHYVRDLPRTDYPRIKGMLLDDFRRQVDDLSEQFEMPSVEACISYLRGGYKPRRDLCLLTFDDGLKEHYREVTPILHERGIEGIFHVITACSEEKVVVPVHMNHFLMADLDFETYRRELMNHLADTCAEAASSVSPELARKTYPWDTPEVAAFKYFFNFVVDPAIRDSAVKTLFERYIGPAREFAEQLYINWDEAREMQAAGMTVGGHTHLHRPLASLSSADLTADLETCTAILRKQLRPSQVWAFCYPYGKSDSYTAETIATIKRLGYDCGFTTESGSNLPGQDLFKISRVDCKKAPVASLTGVAHYQGAM